MITLPFEASDKTSATYLRKKKHRGTQREKGGDIKRQKLSQQSTDCSEMYFALNKLIVYD